MPIYHKPQSTQPKRVATALIGLTKKEKDYLTGEPRRALVKLSNGTGTGADWHTVATRMYVCAYLAYKHYELSGALQVNHTLCSMLSLHLRYEGKGGFWIANKEEVLEMSNCLEAGELMQNQCTRVQFLEAYRDAAVTMARLTGVSSKQSR